MISAWSFRFVVLSAFFFLPLVPLHADNKGVVEGVDIVVHYDEPLKNAALEVVGLYPSIKEELEKILGWEIDFQPSVVLIKDNERFQDIISNPYIIAFAVPAKHLIAVDYSKMNISPFSLVAILKHEMCHLLIGNNIPDERLPRWLNEGFCQWVAGGVAELMVDNRQPTLSKASLSHRLIPLSWLSRNFPGERDQLILAYEESKSVVDYLVAEYGRNSVVQVLGYLREGYSADAATDKVLSLTLGELEMNWIKHLQGQVTWIGYLSANIYTILLFAAAVLTVCGFLRIIIRRRNRASAFDEDENEVGVSESSTPIVKSKKI